MLQSKTTATEAGIDEKTIGHHQPSIRPILKEEEAPLHLPLDGDFFVQEVGSNYDDPRDASSLPHLLGQGRLTSATAQPHAAVVRMLSFEPSAAEVKEEEKTMMETMKMGQVVEEVERGENKELIIPGKRPEESGMRDTSSSLVTDQAAVAVLWFQA